MDLSQRAVRIFLIGSILSIGNDAVASCTNQSQLPKSVYLRTNQSTYNNRYYFTIDHNTVCYKPIAGSAEWEALRIPSQYYDLYGGAESISVDGDRLAILSTNRDLYVMNHAEKSAKNFQWSKEWSSKFLQQHTLHLPPTITNWDISTFSKEKDKFYEDEDATRYPVKSESFSMFYLKREDNYVHFHDANWSHQEFKVCGPLRSRLKMVALSASGSTLFTMGPHGDLFTRRYDLTFSGEYYNDLWSLWKHRLDPLKVFEQYYIANKLTSIDWIQLSKPPGEITDKITVEKKGDGGRFRLFKVEGQMGVTTGYYEAEIDFVREGRIFTPRTIDAFWVFMPTGKALQGSLIKDYHLEDTSNLDLLENGGPNYEVELEGFKGGKLSLVNLDPYCSPLLIKVELELGEKPLEIFLYAHAETESYLELPEDYLKDFNNLKPSQQRFIRTYFGMRRFKSVHLTQEHGKIRIQRDSWRWGVKNINWLFNKAG